MAFMWLQLGLEEDVLHGTRHNDELYDYMMPDVGLVKRIIEENFLELQAASSSCRYSNGDFM